MSTKESLPLEKIRIDGGTQVRARLNYQRIKEFTELFTDYLSGEDGDYPFEPIDVFKDGEMYWLANGFHRYDAAVKAGMDVIDCNVMEGTLQDALWFAYGADSKSALPRTPKERKEAVLNAIAHPNSATMSSREIAKYCGVSKSTVNNIRKGLQTSEEQSEKKKVKAARIGQGSPVKQISKWWDHASANEKQALYARVELLYKRDFAK